MMMELVSPFKIDHFVYPACLPPPNFKIDRDFVDLNGVNDEQESHNPICAIAGWGAESFGDSFGPLQLKQATIPVSTNPATLIHELFFHTCRSLEMDSARS